MSLLDDCEELWNAQDIRVFKEELDETLKPILIGLEERLVEIHCRLNNLDSKIMDLRGEMVDLRGEMVGRLTMETGINRELTDAYEICNTKLQDICNDIETIKLNLKN